MDILDLKPITKDYYIACSGIIGFVKVEGKKVNIKGLEKLDLFIHHPFESKFNWQISEGRGGIAISPHFNKQTQVKLFITTNLQEKGLEYYIKNVEGALTSLNYLGLSPRYKLNENSVKEQAKT